MNFLQALQDIDNRLSVDDSAETKRLRVLDFVKSNVEKLCEEIQLIKKGTRYLGHDRGMWITQYVRTNYGSENQTASYEIIAAIFKEKIETVFSLKFEISCLVWDAGTGFFWFKFLQKLPGEADLPASLRGKLSVVICSEHDDNHQIIVKMSVDTYREDLARD